MATKNVRIVGLATTWDLLPGLTERVRRTIDNALRGALPPATPFICPSIVVEEDGSISI